MIVSNVMTKDPVALIESGKVKDAIKLFRSTKFHNFPVVDGQGKPVGSISALAVLHRAVPAYADDHLLATMEGGPDIESVYRNLERIADMPISQIMNRDIHPVAADTPTSAIAAMLVHANHDSSSILVIDGQGILIGTISARDIVCRAQKV
jgi:CBS domain-containing protein